MTGCQIMDICHKRRMYVMNILLTAIGRRVQLIEHLKKTFNIIGVDASDNNAAKYFCDSFFVIPKCSEPDYIKELLNICVNNNVKMIIPLYEKEFVLLCKSRQIFEDRGIKILLSDEGVINICNDKRLTQEFFERENILSPRPVNDAPAVIKPVNGMGSQGVYSVNTNAELEAAKVLLKNDYIIQEKVEGREYTVDVLCDFEGNAVSVVPRERTEVRSGEVSKSRTVKNKNISDDTIRLIRCLNKYGKVTGPITVQCFVTEENNIVFLEINPRFGGGVPLTFEAGINYGEFLMRFMEGYVHKEVPLDFEELSMVRYDSAVYEKIEIKKH